MRFFVTGAVAAARFVEAVTRGRPRRAVPRRASIASVRRSRSAMSKATIWSVGICIEHNILTERCSMRTMRQSYADYRTWCVANDIVRMRPKAAGRVVKSAATNNDVIRLDCFRLAADFRADFADDDR